MKITGSQQPPLPQVVEEKEGKAPTAAGKKNATGKPQPQDRIELSSSLDAGLQAREAQQAKRVENIKSQLQAGKYRVSSRAVAEKILSRNSENKGS